MSRDVLTREVTLVDIGMSLEDLELYVTHARHGQYLLVAGIALIIWDYFCTVQEEWEFVWKDAPRLVSAKVLFTLNRYLPLFTLIARFSVFNSSLYNPLVCKFALLSATGFAGVINVAIVEAVLLLRVWVLYGKKRSIGIALWCLYALGVGLALAIKYLQPKTNLPFVEQPSYESSKCTKVASAELFFLYGVVLITESIFFTMLVYKAFQSRSARTPIIVALLKQGTLYYLIVMIMLLVTMLAAFSTELYWPIANAVFIVPVVSVACNRLILSLRGMVFSQQSIRRADLGIPLTGSTSQSRSQSSSAGHQYRSPVDTNNSVPLNGSRISAAATVERPPPDRIPRIWINGAFAPTNPDGTPWGTGPTSPERVYSYLGNNQSPRRPSTEGWSHPGSIHPLGTTRRVSIRNYQK